MHPEMRTPTALVVDDDPEELAATCRALGERYPVLSAATGQDAVRIAQSVRPTVIFLDVMMPAGKDGFATFCELQQDPATRSIPVVFLTHVNRASGLPFDSRGLRRYLGRDPAAFLEKPVSSDTLLRVMAGLVGEARRSGS